MKIALFSEKLSRLGIILVFIIGLSACGTAPVISVSKLSADSSRFGAEKPPLSPLATRAPQFRQVFADVAEQVIPVVVSIRSAKVVQVRNFDPFDWFFGQPGEGQPRPNRQPRKQRTEGIGSGVIVSADGYILTNNHVVEEAEDLTVTLSDKREFSATIVGTDPPSDLAVIKLEDASDLPVAHLGDSEKLRIGELVMAIGSPYGLQETVTMGIVSARGRNTPGGFNRYENFIQTDASINPGNSGGALVDLDGSVVGINTMIYSRTGGSQGIGFAIPINMAKHVMEALVSEGRVSRGWLGVSIRDIDGDLAKAFKVEPNSGVLIDDVIEGTPAERAGIESGDIVTHINGKPVKTSTELRDRVAMIKPGTKAGFKILRDGKKMTFNIVLEERDDQQVTAGVPSDATKDKTGLTLQNITPDVRNQFGLDENRKGALIVDVDQSSPAARSRLREGDIIIEANRKKVDSVSDFNRIISGFKDDTILLRVQRAERTFFAPLRLGD
ncbi:MAG: DegQ family serine endoprotease [Gemmatimonadota bacterium]|nr:DegQ family serine endoprotease [Gemmatimonadota bacterium]